MHYVGIGSLNAPIYFYIENKPPLPFYQTLDCMVDLKIGDISYIAHETGNHWRKIFNVFAKLEFERCPLHFDSWQKLREEYLLQKHSKQCLIFNANESFAYDKTKIHIIMGKTYAQKLAIANKCHWLNEYFAIDLKRKIIICPYFDYRQLSNVKITQLNRLITQLMA